MGVIVTAIFLRTRVPRSLFATNQGNGELNESTNRGVSNPSQ
jgi:hypothetical protein